MKTALLLMVMYDGNAVIPVEAVCRDFFSHLTVPKFLRKVGAGEIAIPVIRMESSAKAARGAHLADLAAYIDQRRAIATKECRQLTGG